jgi:hypothetical protein
VASRGSRKRRERCPARYLVIDRVDRVALREGGLRESELDELEAKSLVVIERDGERCLIVTKDLLESAEAYGLVEVKRG